MKFKVGDRVRIKYISTSSFNCLRGKVGEVVKIYPKSTHPYTVKVNDRNLGLSDNYIEPLIKPGEQLLFSFMEEI